MKKHFSEQLKGKKVITKELLKDLKGRSLYSDYQEGDKILSFIEQETGEIDPSYTEPSIILNVRIILERELDRLEEDFIFIRMTRFLPVLKRRK